MIQLECSNCKTNLSIDDAFAGGVCRCQHCGTIQTVPKRGDAAAAGTGASPQPLFKRKARIESALNPYSDNLDRAADEIDSSGALTPSAVANLTGARRSGPTPDDSAAGSSAGYAYAASAGGVATKTKPAIDSAKPFVPRPSTSAAAPSTHPSTPNSKAGTIAAVVVGGIIVLAGSAYFAFSGDSEAATVPERGTLIVPGTDAAPEPRTPTPHSPPEAITIQPPVTPMPRESAPTQAPTTGQASSTGVTTLSVVADTGETEEAQAATHAHEVATTLPAAAAATNPAEAASIVPTSAPVIPQP